jgi:carbamate kinase
MRQAAITNILIGGYFMQTTTKVKQLLPSTAKLTTNEWRVIVTHGEYIRFGKSCASIAFVPGVLGYARRNKFQTDYIQVVCPTTKGNIGSWHINETEAESLLTVARTAPKQDAVNRAWEAGWMQSF